VILLSQANFKIHIYIEFAMNSGLGLCLLENLGASIVFVKKVEVGIELCYSFITIVHRAGKGI